MTSTVVETRTRDAERSKRRLLAAAEQEFAKKGFDAARVDDIAKRAGVNKGLIYLYFGKKDDLYTAVLTDSVQRLLLASRRVMRKFDDPREQTVFLLRNFFEFLVENPAFVSLLAWESMNHKQGSRQDLVRLLTAGLQEMIDSLEHGIAMGVFRRDLNARQLLLSVVGVCLTYFQRRLLMAALWSEDLHQPEVKEEVMHHIMQLLFEGILAQPGQGSNGVEDEP